MMKKRTAIYLFLSILMVVLCSCEMGSKKPNAITKHDIVSSEHDEMYEVVFRDIFNNNASLRQSHVSAYIIEVLDHDPDERLIKALSDVSPPVKKRSDASMPIINGKIDYIYHLHQGDGIAMLFSIENVTYNGDASYIINVTEYEQPLSSAGYYYILKKVGITWQITKKEMTWIS